MPENREFLGGVQQLRSESDRIRNALASKKADSGNYVLTGRIGDAIMNKLEYFEERHLEMIEYAHELLQENRQLKNEVAEIRSEIKANDKKNGEMQVELLQENDQLRQKMDRMRLKLDKIEKKNEEMCEIQKKILEKLIPIREAIVGEWKMVKHENFEGAREMHGWSFELFSENVKYELEGEMLKETGGRLCVFTEISELLHVKDNHLKTSWFNDWTIDRYIQDGKLHSIEKRAGYVWKRIYEKI